jgi:hypothetical protein
MIAKTAPEDDMKTHIVRLDRSLMDSVGAARGNHRETSHGEAEAVCKEYGR